MNCLLRTGVTVGTIQLTGYSRTVTEPIDCDDEAENLRDCLPNVLDGLDGRRQVVGLICSTFNTYTQMIIITNVSLILYRLYTRNHKSDGWIH